jgi:hypothetical protein
MSDVICDARSFYNRLPFAVIAKLCKSDFVPAGDQGHCAFAVICIEWLVCSLLSLDRAWNMEHGKAVVGGHINVLILGRASGCLPHSRIFQTRQPSCDSRLSSLPSLTPSLCLRITQGTTTGIGTGTGNEATTSTSSEPSISTSNAPACVLDCADEAAKAAGCNVV